MKILDAVNLILPKLGERPVTSLELKHPTLGILLPIFESERKQALMHGWWFNEYSVTLHPDPDGHIAVGVDYLSFLPEVPGYAIKRGTRLFNTSTQDYVFTGPVAGRVIVDVPFEELPETMATYVLYEAAVQVCATDLGLSPEVQLWQTYKTQAWSDTLAEHLRQKGYGTRQSQRWLRMRQAMKG